MPSVKTRRAILQLPEVCNWVASDNIYLCGRKGEVISTYCIFYEAIIFVGIPTDDGRRFGSFGTGAPRSSI